MKTLVMVGIIGMLAGYMFGRSGDINAFARAHKFGFSADWFLQMENVLGEWENVALVYGFGFDEQGCGDIAKSMKQNFPRNYRCFPAN